MSQPQTNITKTRKEYVTDIVALLHEPSSHTTSTITRAVDFVARVHGDKKRLSGEPYIVHSVETAKTLARLRMSPDTVVAGILHDSLGEAGGSEEEIRAAFGDTIADLVVNVSKLDRVKYQGNERYVENLRKLLIATAKDIRVLIIRLAHRLHNVQTLAAIPEEKRERIAEETIEIYAPIANRLGMRKLKVELEDAAFPFAYPKEAAAVRSLLSSKRRHLEMYVHDFSESLKKRLAKDGITNARISYRIKGLFSLFRKLQERDMNIDKIFDVAALRVITPSVEDCYRVLGIIHGTWAPVSGKFTDYIATPKPNGYQSIHTVVLTGDGNRVEIQIRTEQMDEEAEYGIAAHLAYSEEGKPEAGAVISKKLQWLKQLIEWQKNVRGSQALLEELKMDFFQNRVFVFTPKGDVIELPEGATPIDFAYAIHSHIGDHASGAVVNDKFVSLDTPLKNGDVVEIQTKRTSKPSRKWLDFARTSEARRHIKFALERK